MHYLAVDQFDVDHGCLSFVCVVSQACICRQRGTVWWCTQRGAQVSRGFPELEPIDVDHFEEEGCVPSCGWPEPCYKLDTHLR